MSGTLRRVDRATHVDVDVHSTLGANAECGTDLDANFHVSVVVVGVCVSFKTDATHGFGLAMHPDVIVADLAMGADRDTRHQLRVNRTPLRPDVRLDSCVGSDSVVVPELASASA